jgi:DNA-binding CsgD family transcriptional regulator
MHIDDAHTWSVLRRIVAGFSTDHTLRQDLMQECAACLCQVEREKPGRTRSWYLLNCRFHVQHWLASGRSVDSPKRAGPNRRVQIDGVVEDAISEKFNTNGDLMEEIFARDMLASLLRRLRPREQHVLRGLAAGLTLREIAAERGISYPTVIRYRRKIARLVLELERPAMLFASPQMLPCEP